MELRQIILSAVVILLFFSTPLQRLMTSLNNEKGVMY